MPKVTSGIRPTPEQKREKDRLRKQKKRNEAVVEFMNKPIEDGNYRTQFIAIDGEGVEDASRKNYTYTIKQGDKTVEVENEFQKYVLLCASTGETLYQPEGISTCDALSWLCNLALKYPNATFVIFGGSYDTTMWLRDLNFAQLLHLRKYMNMNEKERKDAKLEHPRVPAQVDDVPNTPYVIFEYEYTPRKEFHVTRFEAERQEESKGTLLYRRDTRGKRIRHGSIRVWDVIGFFQCKFMKALKEYGLLESEADQDFLQNMKDSRGQFEHFSIEQITEYCLKECTYLVKLMEKMESYLHHPAINLKLTRWDGAGAIASALMKQQGVKDHLEELPSDVLIPALHAYSGGRIELIQYGHKKGKELTETQARLAVLKEADKKGMTLTEELNQQILNDKYIKMKNEQGNTLYVEKVVWDYDINSAYPFTMCSLPSLAGGKWEKSAIVTSRFALCHVRWNLQGQRFYPFFYRTQNSSIIYPTCGEGWYWLPEYEAAIKHQHKYSGSIELLEVWNFHPATDIKPFAFIPEMAKQRLLWKQLAKDSGGLDGGQHIVVKLGLNSLYGKTAQQVGGSYNWKTDEMELPPYHNIAYAGYITSATRAKLYDAAMYNPDAVVMFATDGLFTTSPFPELPLSTSLGEWEVTACSSFTAVQSGVYYYTNEKQKSETKSRGFEQGSITEDMVLAEWNKENAQENDYVVKGTSRHFITFGLIATAQEESTIKKGMSRLCGWETRTRELSLSPYGTKRKNDPKYHPRNNPQKFNPSKQFIPTLPEDNDDYAVSGLFSKMYEYAYLKDVHKLTPDEKAYLVDIEEEQEYMGY